MGNKLKLFSVKARVDRRFLTDRYCLLFLPTICTFFITHRQGFNLLWLHPLNSFRVWPFMQSAEFHAMPGSWWSWELSPSLAVHVCHDPGTVEFTYETSSILFTTYDQTLVRVIPFTSHLIIRDTHFSCCEGVQAAYRKFRTLQTFSCSFSENFSAWWQ